MMIVKKNKLTMIDFLNIYIICSRRVWPKNKYI